MGPFSSLRIALYAIYLAIDTDYNPDDADAFVRALMFFHNVWNVLDWFGER